MYSKLILLRVLMKEAVKQKFLLLSFVCIIIPLLVTGVMMNHIVRQNSIGSFIDSTKREMVHIDTIFSTYFKTTGENAAFLAENDVVKNADYSLSLYTGNFSDNQMMDPWKNGNTEARIYKLYEQFAKSHPDSVYVYMGTVWKGYVQWPNGLSRGSYDPTVRPWFLAAMKKKGDIVITEPYYWAPDDAVQISTVRTITNNNGDIIGVQGLDVSLKNLTEIVKKIRVGKNGYIIIVSAKGMVIAHPKKKEMLFESVKELRIRGFEDVSKINNGSAEVNIDGESSFINMYTSKYNGWKYIAVLSKTEANDQAYKNQKVTITASVFFIAISVILILFGLARKMKEDKAVQLVVLKEKQLRIKEEQFRIVFETSPHGILIVRSADGRCVSLNPAFRKVIGVGPGKIDVCANGAVDQLLSDSMIADVIKTNRVVYNEKITITAGSGDEKVLMVSSSSIMFENDACNLLMVVDVTESRRLEDQLRQSHKMDILGQLTGGIAHDFNNMLGIILGNANLLQLESKDFPSANEYVESILHASKNAADLTSKLLLFSRKGESVSVRMDVHDCIRSAIHLIEISFAKNISLVSNFTAKDTNVVGDPTLIQNAVMNLAINSRDAMPHGGKIYITTLNVTLDDSFLRQYSESAVPGEYVEIEIRDTGEGINKKILPKIFEPFFTTKPEGRGTGLGLATVYGTVREHNGIIRVDSEEGQGTVFRVYLPLGREERYSPSVI